MRLLSVALLFNPFRSFSLTRLILHLLLAPSQCTLLIYIFFILLCSSLLSLSHPKPITFQPTSTNASSSPSQLYRHSHVLYSHSQLNFPIAADTIRPLLGIIALIGRIVEQDSSEDPNVCHYYDASPNVSAATALVRFFFPLLEAALVFFLVRVTLMGGGVPVRDVASSTS